MNADRCLGCYRPLQGSPTGFHPTCARKVFGSATPPLLPYTQDDLLRLAEDAVKCSITVTGAQPKMSIGVEQMDGVHERFAIVGVFSSSPSTAIVCKAI